MNNDKRLDVQWLGDVPDNWRTLKLKFLCDINTGSKDTQDKLPDGRYPFFVRSPHVESLNEFTHDEEAIMTAGDGVGVGKVFHYYEGKFAAHQRVYVFTKFKNVIGKYLYYYLMSNLKFEVLMGGAKSTVDSIRRPMLSEFPVVFPDIFSQRQIVRFLDMKETQINNLIELKEKYISLLEQQRQSIITEAVTKGLNSNVKMKDSGVEWIGEIPEYWNLSKVKYEAFINSNALNENIDPFTEIEYIDIGSVNSKGEILKTENYRFEDAPSRARRIVNKGDTLISTVRTYLKAITTIEFQQENLIASTGFAVLTPKEKISSKYLGYIFKSSVYVDEIVSRSTGVSYPAINASEIGNLELIFPSIEEQNSIIQYLDEELNYVDSTIRIIETQINKLKEYRQSLIYEAVTGKSDVREMEID